MRLRTARQGVRFPPGAPRFEYESDVFGDGVGTRWGYGITTGSQIPRISGRLLRLTDHQIEADDHDFRELIADLACPLPGAAADVQHQPGLVEGCQQVRPQGFPESVVLDVEAMRLSRMTREEVFVSIPAAQPSRRA